MTSRFTAARQAQETTNVSDALLRVRDGDDATPATAPRSTRSSPRPTGRRSRAAAASATRRPAGRARSVGGCGIWNRDADWANDTVVAAMNGDDPQRAPPSPGSPTSSCSTCRTRSSAGGCARHGVGCWRRRGIASWQSPGAVDRSEWVEQIRTTTRSSGPTSSRRTAHANYWGQLAMRNCLRHAYNGGAVRGGTCVRVANGLNAQGEPVMGLQ